MAGVRPWRRLEAVWSRRSLFQNVQIPRESRRELLAGRLQPHRNASTPAGSCSAALAGLPAVPEKNRIIDLEGPTGG
jgi:hypothetical protein